MIGAPLKESSVSEIEKAMDDLNNQRAGLQRQLHEVRGLVPVADNESVEMSLKKYLKSWYKPDGIPHATRPDPKALETEVAVINESLERLRVIRLEAKAKHDLEQTQNLMPAYLKSVAKLREAIDAAVEANKAVMEYERQFLTPRPYSLGWDCLRPLGWSFGTTLRDWRARVERLLASLDKG